MFEYPKSSISPNKIALDWWWEKNRALDLIEKKLFLHGEANSSAVIIHWIRG